MREDLSHGQRGDDESFDPSQYLDRGWVMFVSAVEPRNQDTGVSDDQVGHSRRRASR